MSLSQEDIQALLDQFKAEDQLLIANYNQESKYLLDNCFRESITLGILTGKKCGATLYSDMNRTPDFSTSGLQTEIHEGSMRADNSQTLEGENTIIQNTDHTRLQVTHHRSLGGNNEISVNDEKVAFINKNKPQRKLSHSFSSEDLATLAKKKRQRKISQSYSSEEIHRLSEKGKASEGDAYYNTYLTNLPGSSDSLNIITPRDEGSRPVMPMDIMVGNKTDNYGEGITGDGLRKGLMRRYFHESKTDLSSHAASQRDAQNDKITNVDYSSPDQNKKSLTSNQEPNSRDVEDNTYFELSSSNHKNSDLSNQVVSHTDRSKEESFVVTSPVLSASTSRRSHMENASLRRETDKVGARRRKVSFFCGQPLAGIDSLFTTQESIEKEEEKELYQNEEDRTHEEELRKNKFRTNHWPGRKMSRSSFVYHL